MYYVGAGAVLLSNFIYSIILSIKHHETKQMPDWLFWGIWISQILSCLIFFGAIQDKFSVWRQNCFFWMLMIRQIFAFFNFQSVDEGAKEIFFALKVLLLYVMITVYHSHFGIPYEIVRIVVIMLVYFFVGVAICQKSETEGHQFIDLMNKHLASILTFTFFCFFINFTITLVIRYYQEELVKYLYSKIQQ